jgi:hypothetical protein
VQASIPHPALRIPLYDGQLSAKAGPAAGCDNDLLVGMVTDRDKHLVGIVSLGGLAVETGDEQLAANTLEVVSEPNRPDR